MTKQILNIPAKMIKSTGSAMKGVAQAAMQPASTAATWHFVLGAILAAPVSSLYGFAYNRTIGRLGLPNVVNAGLKILLPLVPIYFVKTSKIPFGNIINGGLAGVVAAQALNIVFGLMAGQTWRLTGLQRPRLTPTQLEPVSSSWFDKLM